MSEMCKDFRHNELSATREGCPYCRPAFLRERGWSQWYNPDYWVHPKTVQDASVQDYTNYGLTLEQAVEFERTNAKPFPSIAPAQRAISALYQPTPPSAPPAETRKCPVCNGTGVGKNQWGGDFTCPCTAATLLPDYSLQVANLALRQRIADLEQQLTASESVVEEMRKAFQDAKDWLDGSEHPICQGGHRRGICNCLGKRLGDIFDAALSRASALKREANDSRASLQRGEGKQ